MQRTRPRKADPFLRHSAKRFKMRLDGKGGDPVLFPSQSDILSSMAPQAASGKRSTPMDRSRIQSVVRDLAQFRYALRKFLRFSENAARTCGITPQQHQLLLGVQGFTDHGSATISELAEFLQERHHSVVGLVERAEQNGLVRRTQDELDRRVVNVTLTPSGRKILFRLTRMHYEEAKRLRSLWESCELSNANPAGRGTRPSKV
jgi:DNA-binding MarR family transcriptional regulator